MSIYKQIEAHGTWTSYVRGEYLGHTDQMINDIFRKKTQDASYMNVGGCDALAYYERQSWGELYLPLMMYSVDSVSRQRLRSELAGRVFPYVVNNFICTEMQSEYISHGEYVGFFCGDIHSVVIGLSMNKRRVSHIAEELFTEITGSNFGHN